MPAANKYFVRYKTLTITVPGETCGDTGELDLGPVDVIRYSNTGSSGTQKQNVAGLDDGSKDRVARFLNAYKAEKAANAPFPSSYLPAGFSSDSINNVYMGKASPDSIRAALLLYACYEEKGGIVRRRWSSPEALEQGLNQHCVDRIGLDCLGFVVNFVNDTRSTKFSEDQIGNIDMQYFTGYVKGAKKLRTSPDQVKEGDILVYLWKSDLGQNSRHIAVVDSVLNKSAASAAVKIAESYGGVGPRVTQVELEQFPGGSGSYGPVLFLNRAGDKAKVYLVPALT